jgi:hypothetical protein
VKTVNVTSWEDFLVQLNDVKERYERYKKSDSGWISPLLFRGQANHKWCLETSLERYTKQEEMPLEEYYRVISDAKNEIESFTERHWEIPGMQEYIAWLNDNSQSKPAPPGYEYMIYLRHHGFPSPLLDWTKSPNIAAYFAFREPLPYAESVSIYAFIECLRSMKSYCSDAPFIKGLGPKVRSHRRHHLQQSEYTICLRNNNARLKDDNNDKWVYASHEEAFRLSEDWCGGEEEYAQDLCWKFNIPATERNRVLKLLNEYNLNAFSLFGTEESLMETLAQRNLHVFRKAE